MINTECYSICYECSWGFWEFKMIFSFHNYLFKFSINQFGLTANNVPSLHQLQYPPSESVQAGSL